ncbi:hypothetical protein HBE96_17200 [Clostridium sp. P21]|uniref:Uncharacterized protein n=1 Tax=Clostridium muellerianum TaxID=2716538 RepID=A0A7Y0EL06_9CLOT|nr:hypothetical protein [Clostridium muellerianum]NMM64360.1 hypothetical protein [Clostridium muellerianum]
MTKNKNTTDNDTKIMLYIIAGSLPVIGMIIGAIFTSTSNEEKNNIGKKLLKISFFFIFVWIILAMTFINTNRDENSEILICLSIIAIFYLIYFVNKKVFEGTIFKMYCKENNLPAQKKIVRFLGLYPNTNELNFFYIWYKDETIYLLDKNPKGYDKINIPKESILNIVEDDKGTIIDIDCEDEVKKMVFEKSVCDLLKNKYKID